MTPDTDEEESWCWECLTCSRTNADMFMWTDGLRDLAVQKVAVCVKCLEKDSD